MTPLFLLLRVFLQIGLFSIGGGYAIIPLIQEQVVDTYGWITQKAFTDMITISQMTPGPLAVNTSTFVGLQIAGIPGALLATTGCVISGILISLTLYLFFGRHRDSTCVFEILRGLKSASVGLIVSAAATIILLTFFKEPKTAAVPSIFGWEAAACFFFTPAQMEIQSDAPHRPDRRLRLPALSVGVPSPANQLPRAPASSFPPPCDSGGRSPYVCANCLAARRRSSNCS